MWRLREAQLNHYLSTGSLLALDPTPTATG